MDRPSTYFLGTVFARNNTIRTVSLQLRNTALEGPLFTLELLRDEDVCPDSESVTLPAPALAFIRECVLAVTQNVVSLVLLFLYPPPCPGCPFQGVVLRRLRRFSESQPAKGEKL